MHLSEGNVTPHVSVTSLVPGIGGFVFIQVLLKNNKACHTRVNFKFSNFQRVSVLQKRAWIGHRCMMVGL